MARPEKSGVDYFPHDVDLSSDQKVEYIEAIYGLEGYAIFVKLLEKIYRDGYFLYFGKRQRLIFANRYNIDPEKLDQMIVDFIEIGLFNENLYFTFDIITSRSLQQRYIKCTERRKYREIISEFALITDNINPENTKIIPLVKSKCTHKLIMNGIDGNKSTQSKVKESKYNILSDIIGTQTAGNLDAPVDNSVDNLADDGDGLPPDPPDPEPDDPNVPHKKIVDMWNTMMHPLKISRVNAWSEDRKKHLRARWKESKERQSLEWWEELFKKIQKSDFCMGKVPPKPGHTLFKITLPWLLLPSNFSKVLDGNYENKQKAPELTEPQQMIRKAKDCYRKNYEVMHQNCGYGNDCCKFCLCVFLPDRDKYQALLKEHGAE